jgi:hypothetical protein
MEEEPMRCDLARAALVPALLLGVLACGEEEFTSVPRLPANDTTIVTDDRDRVSPTVVAFTPGDGETQVGLNASVRVTFSEPLAPVIARPALMLQSGTSSWSVQMSAEDPFTLVFAPKTPLLPGTEYWVTLTTSIQDTAGNPLREPFSWTFRTAGSPVP